jgi:hypothetical protein
VVRDGQCLGLLPVAKSGVELEVAFMRIRAVAQVPHIAPESQSLY